MKKIISVILSILIIFMLEFNLLKGILPGIYMWVESMLAFGILITLVVWNDLVKTKSKDN